MRPTTPAEREQIERLLELPEDRLLVLLGYSLPETAGTLFSPKEAQRRAEQWFAAFVAKHRDAICDAYRRLTARADYQGDVTLVASIADLIAALAAGVGGFTVAALLVQRGLKKLCGDAPRSV